MVCPGQNPRTPAFHGLLLSRGPRHRLRTCMRCFSERDRLPALWSAWRQSALMKHSDHPVADVVTFCIHAKRSEGFIGPRAPVELLFQRPATDSFPLPSPPGQILPLDRATVDYFLGLAQGKP